MSFTLYQSGILHGLPDRLVIERDGVSLGDFFLELAELYGEQVLEEVLDGDGNVAGEALVILNGGVIHPPQALAAKIPPGSELVISALIAGG
ncbi:MAG: hypothetical protein FWG28_01765 [Clostridiales bacterium]|nr:hypothetical protein [Clostridiales bacterium]